MDQVRRRKRLFENNKGIKLSVEDTTGIVDYKTYERYLNGEFYGSGDLAYMKELFIDYVVTCEMYGREQCEFSILKTSMTKSVQ